MNQTSVVLTTLLHYNVQVRDTLEYCLRKDTYDVNLFNEKKRSVLVEVDQHTPLKNIIDNSGENGEKLEKAIRDFYAEVYGDDSTILHLADDGLRVDHNQHVAIYKHVLPIHENVTSMINGILNDAHSKNIDVAQAEEVAKAEEAMYRGVCFLTLVQDLNRFFDEYNKARNEAKGEETPASRFIGQDISAMIQNINFVRANARLTNAVYKNMEDKVVALTEYMTGRRDLPAGKRFPDVMRETAETINLFVRDAEAAFRAVYPDCIKALLEQVKADDERRSRGEKPETGASANDPVEAETPKA
ncbi:MAG: hypothetical protein J6A47_10360 [Bacilli bacterium]|nr:hypothetical protein [Bacilli bacterium]MBO6284803.1 hypothetical protein [Bacilli bacterium]